MGMTACDLEVVCVWSLTSLQSQFFLVPFADVLLPCHLGTGEGVGGRQADGLDDGREGDGALQLQHSDVIVVGVVIEEGVGDYALDFAGLHIGAAEVTLVGQTQVGCPQAGVRVPAWGA